MDSSNPTEWTYNGKTGKVTKREIDAETLAEYAALTASVEAERLAKENAKLSAQTKLAALGLTPEEIEAI
jgi:hypothetical protein